MSTRHRAPAVHKLAATSSASAHACADLGVAALTPEPHGGPSGKRRPLTQHVRLATVAAADGVVQNHVGVKSRGSRDLHALMPGSPSRWVVILDAPRWEEETTIGEARTAPGFRYTALLEDGDEDLIMPHLTPARPARDASGAAPGGKPAETRKAALAWPEDAHHVPREEDLDHLQDLGLEDFNEGLDRRFPAQES